LIFWSSFIGPRHGLWNRRKRRWDPTTTGIPPSPITTSRHRPGDTKPNGWRCHHTKVYKKASFLFSLVVLYERDGWNHQMFRIPPRNSRNDPDCEGGQSTTPSGGNLSGDNSTCADQASCFLNLKSHTFEHIAPTSWILFGSLAAWIPNGTIFGNAIPSDEGQGLAGVAVSKLVVPHSAGTRVGNFQRT
jgi:hypothetical protein